MFKKLSHGNRGLAFYITYVLFQISRLLTDLRVTGNHTIEV